MKIWGVIPARYHSQRLPGKPLVKLGDRPLIEWVYRAAQQCSQLSQVVVATDHQVIADCVRGFGGQVQMTHPEHRSGTDRVAEVVAQETDVDVVVNIQGDQPFVTAELLQSLVTPYLEGQQPEMTTLACPLNQDTQYADPNAVKVICDRQSRALYFSRAPIPYFRHSIEAAPVFHHLGLYAFRRDFLAIYSNLSPTPLEQCESLEQLRVLEHGYSIQVCHTSKPILEINTPEDLEKAQGRLPLN